MTTRIQLLERNINVISRFMESFNHGTALPPTMINAFRRIEAVETEMKKLKENEKKKPVTTEEKKTGVDSVIETTTIVSRDEKCPLKTVIDTVVADVKKIRRDLDDRNRDVGIRFRDFSRMESDIKKLFETIKNLQKQLDESHKLIEELKTNQLTKPPVPSVVERERDVVSRVEFNAAMKKQKEEVINEVTNKLDAAMKKQKEEVINEVTNKLDAAMKKQKEEVTDKIDAEIIDLEERLKSGKAEGKCENMEALIAKISCDMNELEKRLSERISAIAEGVIGEDDDVIGEEEDEETQEEEDDLDDCIDMD